jgi:hypothetical protein
MELTWARYVAGTAWGYTGPGFSVDDEFLHYYTNGNWGTWGDGHTAIGACPCAQTFQWPLLQMLDNDNHAPCGLVELSGICERPAGVQYEVFVRDTHMMHVPDGNAGGGH